MKFEIEWAVKSKLQEYKVRTQDVVFNHSPNFREGLTLHLRLLEVPLKRRQLS